LGEAPLHSGRIEGRLFSQYLPWLLTGLLLIEFLLLAFTLGPRLSNDSIRDDLLSDLLIAVHFDPVAFGEKARIPEPPGQPYLNVERTPQPQSPRQYFVWVSVIALMKLVLGGAWEIGVLTINALALTLSALVMMRLVAWMVNGAAAIVFVGLAYGLFWDQFIFMPWIHSDTIFNLMAAAMFAICVGCVVTDSRTLAWRLCLAVSLGLVATVFRPPGFVLLASVGLFAGYCQIVRRGVLADGRAAGPLWVAGVLAICLFALMAQAYVVYHPSLWPDGAGRGTIEWMNLRTGAGEVVISRPETFLQPPRSWLGVAAVGLAKFVYFFAFLAQDFSRSHTVASIIWYFPFYSLVLRGGFAAVFAEKDLSSNMRHAGIFAITMILLFATFHAATLVDFEWRYRIPIYPVMIFLAMLGGRQLVRDWRRLYPVAPA